MILLGFCLFLFIFVLSTRFAGCPLWAYYDPPSSAFVFLGVLLHVLICGRQHFLPGLRALIRLPKSGDPGIAKYYRHLTEWTLLLGILGMLFGVIGSYSYPSPDVLGVSIAFGVLSFFYATGLTLLLFWPISLRYSATLEDDASPSSKRYYFPLRLTFFGLAAYFMTRALMVSILVAMSSLKLVDGVVQSDTSSFPTKEILQKTFFSLNPTDFYGTVFGYLSLDIYYDLPTLLSILVSLATLRLAAGQQRNRMNWIPVNVLYGVFWSVFGFVIILGNMDPKTYAMGCMVALLSALYGLVGAVLVVIGSRRFAALFVLGFIILTWTEVLLRGQLDVSTPSKAISTYAFYAVLIAVFVCILCDGIQKRLRPVESPAAEPPIPQEGQAQSILDSAVRQQQERL